MTNPHTLKVLIWFSMSAIIILSLWFYYRIHINLAYKTMLSAKENQDKDFWMAKINSLRRERNTAVAFIPGTVAIIVLLFVF